MHLKELLAANQPLLCVYVLRDELKRLWFYRKPPGRKRPGSSGSSKRAKAGSLPCNCSRSACKAYWHGILARCRHPLNTSVVEGINNTIKVIKRRAYGYSDEEYFSLKIRTAFPGNPR